MSEGRATSAGPDPWSESQCRWESRCKGMRRLRWFLNEESLDSFLLQVPSQSDGSSPRNILDEEPSESLLIQEPEEETGRLSPLMSPCNIQENQPRCDNSRMALDEEPSDQTFVVSDFIPSFLLHQSLDRGQCWYYSGVELGAPCWLGQMVLLTGAVAELEAQVRASEAVDGDGKLEELRPARTVVVVEDEAPVVSDTGLTATLEDAVLQGAAERQREGATSENKRKRERTTDNRQEEKKEEKHEGGEGGEERGGVGERHLEELPVSEQQQHGDLHVLLDALPTSLKVTALQGHVEVVTHVTWGVGGINQHTHRLESARGPAPSPSPSPHLA